jgi:hypothetical protein
VSQFTLTAARRGVSSVSVDDKTLILDGPAVELDDKQVERLTAINGVEISPVDEKAPAKKAKSDDSSSTTGGSSASTAKD